jgi:hypothetical protein
VFSTQDANGDFRSLFVQASCDSLAQIAQGTPGSEAVLAVTGILTSANTCPKQAAANRSAYAQRQQTQGAGSSPNALSSATGTLTTGAKAAHLFYPKLPTN